MKKTLLLIIISLFITPQQLFAEQCDGGEIITGINQHKYCRSIRSMNWWSAFSWCEMQGRHLAAGHEACDISKTEKWDGSFIRKGNCKNLAIGYSDPKDSVPRVFLSTVVDKSVGIIYLEDEYITYAGRTNLFYALCY